MLMLLQCNKVLYLALLDNGCKHEHYIILQYMYITNLYPNIALVFMVVNLKA